MEDFYEAKQELTEQCYPGSDDEYYTIGGFRIASDEHIPFKI